MTHYEAVAECERLSREHPERETHRWAPRQAGDGSWEVARLALPEGLRRGPLHETTEAKPRPPEADDPRPAQWRDVGGPYGPA